MILALKGATVNGVANTILRNNGTGTTTLTLQNIQGSGTLTMGVRIANSAAVIDAVSPITISSILSSSTAGYGFTKTGAGTLTLSAASANTYSGNTTIQNGTVSIGNDTATLGDGTGTLVLAGGNLFRASQTTAQTFANPISLTADSAIIGNPTTGSRTIPFSSSSVSGSAGTLTISNSAASGSGLLQVRFSGGFSFSRPVVVNKAFSGSGIMLQSYNNVAAGDQTWSGLISGNGTLYRNVIGSGGGGNTILSSANTYTGGTEVRAGFFGLGADNCLGTGLVTIGADPNPLGLFASGAARVLTNNITVDTAIATSTNFQIKGSQNLTLSGRFSIHSNLTQLIISNTATTTFSSVLTNAFPTSLGIWYSGPGTLVLSGNNTFSGSAIVGAGTLALTGNGSIMNTTNITISAGATLDVSGLVSTLILSDSQTLRTVSPNGANATISCSGTAGVTLGSTSPLVLAYSNGIPALTVTGGVLTVASGDPATVTIFNGGPGLVAGDYKLISAGAGGSVAGAAPTGLTVAGDGIAGSSPSLVISNSELYLRVLPSVTPPATPVANAASSTNLTFFTASWNPASGADAYRLDVSTVNDFSSFVPGYSDLDVGAVTSYVVTNLSPATTYFYQVRATNLNGSSANSSTITVNTLVAPFVWNTGSGNWSAPGSWQYANVPVNGASPGFTGAGGGSANDLTGLLLRTITFSNGAGAYVLSGNGLVVSNGVINNSAVAQTVSAPLTLGAPQTFSAASGALNISGPITNAGNTLTFSAAASSTNSGSVSGSGALVKTGAGTLLLSGANTYTGATTNNAGNLRVTGGSALSDTANLSLANTAGVTLTVDANETVGSLSGGDSSTIALGANVLTVGGDGAITTNTSAITGAGKVVKIGAGTFTLNKATAIGPDLNLRVEGGILDLNRNGSLLSGLLGAGNHIELAGGTLQLSAGVQASFWLTTGGFEIYSNTMLYLNRMTVNSATSSTNSSALNFRNSATLSFGYSASITGGTTLFDAPGHTLQGNATFALGNYGISIVNPIGESGGSYGITKTGAGQLNLQGINTYSGNTTNLQGVLSLNGTSTLGNGSGAMVFAGGDLLMTSTRASVPVPNAIVLATAVTNTIYGDSVATAPSTRIVNFSGAFGGSSGALRVGNKGLAGNTFELRLSGGGYTFTQPLIVGDSGFDTGGALTTLKFYNDTNTASQIFSGVISGNGSIMRDTAVAGAGGTTILSGANTYSGTTTNSGGFLGFGASSTSSGGAVTSGPVGTGILEIQNDPNVGVFAEGAARTIANTIFLNGVTNVQFNGTYDLTLSGLVRVGTVAKTLTVNNAGVTTISGVLSNAAALTKAGAGTLVLSGTNVNTGNITNASGTLLVHGSLNVASAVDVLGGTLGGTGVVNGPITVEVGGTLAPGAGIGTLNVGGNVTLDGTTLIEVDKNASQTSDKVLGIATLSEGGNLQVSNVGAAFAAGDSFPVFAAATYTGAFTDVTPAPGAGLAWDTELLRTNGTLLVHLDPVAGSNDAEVSYGQTTTIPVFKLLANDTGEPGETLSITAVSTNASLGGGLVTYTAPWTGSSDTITYTLSDGRGGTATGTINVALSNGTGFNQISAVTIAGGDLQLMYLGIPGTNYALEISHDLTPPVNWSALQTNPASPVGAVIFTNTPSGAPTNDFYRTHYVP